MPVHSVLWAVALNTHAGFRQRVSTTHRMVGQDHLRVAKAIGASDEAVLIPAAFPSISGRPQDRLLLARSHRRSLIAAELACAPRRRR